jgi:N-glycosylase/DNA lyase
MPEVQKPSQPLQRPEGNEWTLIPAPDFDVEKTLNSGQVFHWLPAGKGFAGAIDQTPVYVEQAGDSLLAKKAHADLVIHYFALDHPLPRIRATFPRDSAMNLAAEFSNGLRIVRQPRWECLATFLTSALKQVQHIRTISLLIRTRFGRPLREGELRIHAYPPPRRVAEIPLPELLECKLGFRAANLIASAKLIAEGVVDLDSIANLSTEAARAHLRTLPGVGEKIANCVLLFAFERLDAVPIDVWISRVMSEVYFSGRGKVSTREMKSFAADYFGPYAGYAQQYLFHHWRLTYRKKR